MAEFAVQGKACIVVPNPVLTGGQQLHNAKVLSDNDAALVLDEKEVSAIGEKVDELLLDPKNRLELGQQLHKLASRDAAKLLAQLLLEI